MALVTLDFDLDKESAVLPAGTYKFAAEEAELTESSNGNPMVKIKWSVVEDPQYTGRVVYDNLVLIPSMARRIKDLGTGMGLDFRKGVDPDTMIGGTTWADTMIEEYQGTESAKIKKYRSGR